MLHRSLLQSPRQPPRKVKGRSPKDNAPTEPHGDNRHCERGIGEVLEHGADDDGRRHIAEQMHEHHGERHAEYAVVWFDAPQDDPVQGRSRRKRDCVQRTVVRCTVIRRALDEESGTGSFARLWMKSKWNSSTWKRR